MIYGYARVSTQDQNLALQQDALSVYGVDETIVDKISGKRFDRSGLTRLCSKLQFGDKVVVYKLDRLGRSLIDLLKTVQWFKDNGIEFVSLKETIDTSTPTGRLIFNIFATLAEFERDLISERTKAGLQAAKKRGKVLGRTPYRGVELEMAEVFYKRDRMPVSEIAKKVGLSKQYIYRKVVNV